MSYSINKGVTDTVVSGTPGPLTLNRPVINYGTDFRVKSSSATEDVIVNITSPNARPETVRFASTPIKDVYQGLNIDPAVQSPNHSGVNVLAQLNQVWSVTDSVDTKYRVDLPVSAHLVIKLPYNDIITAADTEALVSRLISMLYEQAVTDTSRYSALAKGALLPKNVN